MLRQVFLIMILLGLMTACTTSDPVTDIPFATATPRPIESPEPLNSIGDAAIPLEFAGGEPVVLFADYGNFDFAVSGDFISQADTGTIIYSYLPNSGTIPPRNQLYIAASDATSSQQISFEFSPDIEIGQYNLIAPEDYFTGGASVSYARLAFDGNDTRVQAFSENISGTLTAVGEVLSGQFQFSADFTETSLEGEVDMQSIEVTGSFERVPYQVPQDDPFDNEIPLPTRNFTDDATEQP